MVEQLAVSISSSHCCRTNLSHRFWTVIQNFSHNFVHKSSIFFFPGAVTVKHRCWSKNSLSKFKSVKNGKKTKLFVHECKKRSIFNVCWNLTTLGIALSLIVLMKSVSMTLNSIYFTANRIEFLARCVTMADWNESTLFSPFFSSHDAQRSCFCRCCCRCWNSFSFSLKIDWFECEYPINIELQEEKECE